MLCFFKNIFILPLVKGGMKVDVKQLKTFAITHVLANIFLAIMCVSLILKTNFEVEEMLHWFCFLFVFGLCATFITKRRISEYLLASLIALPIALPIIYSTMNGLFSGKIILFDALGFLFIHYRFKQLDEVISEDDKQIKHKEE